MVKYIAECWIHPECGGDDEYIKLAITAENEKIAKSMIKKKLKEEGSCITNDFVLKKIK